MTIKIDATSGEAFELTFIDGSTLRLLWDKNEMAVELSAQTLSCGRCLANELVIRPRAANSVVLVAK